jgi:LysM repeat protein
VLGERQQSYKYYLLVAVGMLWIGLIITACNQALSAPDPVAPMFVTVTPGSDPVAVQPPATLTPSSIVTPTSSITATPTSTTTIQVAVVPPSNVRRELPQVWAGPTNVPELEWLGDETWRKLEEGGLVTTDANGEGWVDFSEAGTNECMLVYLFQDSELIKAPCAKLDYEASNATCLLAGTNVYNNSCPSEILIQTLSADIRLQGTWAAVTYLEDREVTVVMVFDAASQKVDEVSVQPVQQVDPRILDPSSVKVVEEQFWFTAPGVTADPIAGLEARVAHPFERLLPLVEELDLWPWIERIKARADDDNVPYPNFPPFGPTPTPIPPTPIATVCGPPPNWVPYRVQAEDTLFSLARETRTTVAQIKQANCLVGDAVYRGQLLYLPFVPATPTPTPTPCGPPPYWVPYQVQAEDTLYSLARQTQITVPQIIRANCLVSDVIFEGQILYLPFVPTPPPTIPPPVEQLEITAVEFLGDDFLDNPSTPTTFECPQQIFGVRVFFNKELYPITVNKESFEVSWTSCEPTPQQQWSWWWVGVDPDNPQAALFKPEPYGDETAPLPLPCGTYEVTLHGDQDGPAITDKEGNYLDGEPYGLPSGNGTAGGNFEFQFSVPQCGGPPYD